MGVIVSSPLGFPVLNLLALLLRNYTVLTLCDSRRGWGGVVGGGCGGQNDSAGAGAVMCCYVLSVA